MSKPIETFRREYPDVARALDEQKWAAQLSPSGHIHFRDGAGVLRATAAATPSDRRSWDNSVADLKRRGLVVTPIERSRRRKEPTPYEVVTQLNVPPIENKDPLIETYGLFMTYRQIEDALDLRNVQVRDAAKQRFFGREFKTGRGPILFDTVNVIAFRDAGYRELFPKRRVYTKRSPKWSGVPDAPTMPTPADVMKVVNHEARDAIERGKANGVTIRAIQEALRPVIREEVLNALREFYRER